MLQDALSIIKQAQNSVVLDTNFSEPQLHTPLCLPKDLLNYSLVFINGGFRIDGQNSIASYSYVAFDNFTSLKFLVARNKKYQNADDAEFRAIKRGLKEVTKAKCTHVLLFLDSRNVIEALNGYDSKVGI